MKQVPTFSITTAVAMLCAVLSAEPALGATDAARGARQKVHFPLYDAVTVRPGVSVADALGDGLLLFFVGGEGKSRLETNQGAFDPSARGVRFEIHSLRVTVAGGTDGPKGEGFAGAAGEDANARLVGAVAYGSSTTLMVGEKIMIQHPTFYFPAGGGVAGLRASASNGVPSTAATFRFAEPVLVEKQQNFRVEIEFPDRDLVQQELSGIFGPARIWVTLDGFLTRDVQ